MNISIIGPENSGKSYLANEIAKKLARLKPARPVLVIGGERSPFQKIALEKFAEVRNAVVILDDANAFFDNYDLQRKENREMKAAIFKSRWRGRINIFVFHSLDDSVKLFYRQSKFIYVSKKYRDASYRNNKFLKGITPEEFGRKGFIFLRYQRY